MRLIRWVLIIVFAVLPLAVVVAVVFVPGPHRVVAPAAFGLSEVLPGVYSDATDREAEMAAMLARTDARTVRFFGAVHPRRRTILCTQPACRETFGIPGRALTIADMAILTAPSGVSEATLFHEQVHVELNARMGPLDALWPRYPSWFNEGLATFLSGTPHVRGPERVADAQWITAAKTPLGWRLARRGRQPSEYYGAARRMVAGIEAEIGPDGLARLVAAVAEGADFSDALAAQMSR